MTYHLLDHVNRLNAAELAKPRDARTNMTPGWAPPSEVVFATKPVDGFVRANMARPFPRTHSLGRGDKIRCGMPLLPGQHIHTRQLDSKHYNVCRPFNEAHAHPESRSLVEHLDALIHQRGQGRADDAASFFGVPASFSKHVTQPNHGHGSKCGCFFFAPNWDLSLVEPEIQGRRRMTAMVLSSGMRVIVRSASTGLVSPQDCPWCAGTGRIICDQDSMGGRREARVSPSHAAGGYAEWQRENEAGTGYGRGPSEALFRASAFRQRAIESMANGLFLERGPSNAIPSSGPATVTEYAEELGIHLDERDTQDHM